MEKTREEIARFIEGQFGGTVTDPCPRKPAFHYGKCELRQLMDFIFDGLPTLKSDELFQLKGTLKFQSCRAPKTW